MQQVVTQTTGAKFQINNVKPYVPVVTFSINDNINFLDNTKPVFKRTIYWNNYRSELTTQTKSNNLDYLIDETFRNIDRLFVLSFKIGDNEPAKDSFERHYMHSVEIKDFFTAFIDKKPIFLLVKNKQEAYAKLIEMSKNDDYATGNLLDYLHHEKYYKLIGIDLSIQTKMSILQQINFTGKLEEDDGATMVFISVKQQKNILNFSLNSFTITE